MHLHRSVYTHARTHSRTHTRVHAQMKSHGKRSGKLDNSYHQNQGGQHFLWLLEGRDVAFLLGLDLQIFIIFYFWPESH